MKKFQEELADFLQSYFNQDMESVEKAWSEFVRENKASYKSELKRLILQFVEDTNLSHEEKEEFLEKHTDIYFPNAPMPPVEWLQSLAKRLDWVQEVPGVYIREYSANEREVVVIQAIDGTHCTCKCGIIPTTPLERCRNHEDYLAVEKNLRAAYPSVPLDTMHALHHDNCGNLVFVAYGDMQDVLSGLLQLGYDDLPPLSFTFLTPSQEWIVRNGLASDNEIRKVFVRKPTEDSYEAVQVITFKDGSSSVYYRLHDFASVAETQAEGLEMLYEHGMLPTDDLAIEACEFSTHGASGMDRCHHDLMRDDDIQSILQNQYGIHLPWK